MEIDYIKTSGYHNPDLSARYLPNPVKDLIQRVVPAMGAVPGQEEVNVQSGILQFGGKGDRNGERSVPVAGAVSHVPVRRIGRLGVAHEIHRIHQENIPLDFFRERLTG